MILLWTMPVAIRRRRYLKASKRGQRASMQLKLKLSNLLIISIITYFSTSAFPGDDILGGMFLTMTIGMFLNTVRSKERSASRTGSNGD